jgi:hypothetical protein
MPSRFHTLLTGVALLGAAGVSGPGGIVHAGSGPTTPPSALQVGVDKPIAHLGERVVLWGRHFTPGATVTVYLHGPNTATLGRVYGRVVVARDGGFALPILLAGYPDNLARLWHTVDVAALSSAQSGGVQEGAMAPVQLDPMPGLEIATRGALTRTLLVIDGTPVKASVTARDARHYRVSYGGHLRAGLHSAYLKWVDASGAYGARAWSFRIGSPYDVVVPQTLTLDRTRIALGESVVVTGQHWTPGATVTVSLAGPNTPPSGRVYGRAVVDGRGGFTLRVRVVEYPDANARSSRAVIVNAVATGTAVGDLPEAMAVMLRVIRS